eukprot:7900695-Alexandrium_andersonii.AAC.1
MQLEEVYTGIFHELHASGLKQLRLLPVSGGIYSGHLAAAMPRITFRAILSAFEKLDASIQAFVRT